MGFPLADHGKKMNPDNTYELAVVGGGLAGLTLAIQVRMKGHSVILFEKEKYPFHRVCGEYVSLESLGFLKSIGIDPDYMDCPVINNLIVTAPDGTLLKQELPLGGFGISRYTLDQKLASIAVNLGVKLNESDKVHEVSFKEGFFEIRSGSGTYASMAAAGCFGKRSNLDLKWKRSFAEKKPSKLNNYIGVKYHIKTDFPKDTIALHNFADGYCGISAIEDGKYCLCYLTTAANLESNNHSIKDMQEHILYQNPHLKKIFTSSAFFFEQPVAISQISFENKSMFEDHVLMIGDAAGMITPLCGNGMSMAMHGSKLAAKYLEQFLKHEISRHEMETHYSREWKHAFSGRLRTGRWIQSLFGKPATTNFFIRTMKPFPFLVRQLIRNTHGQPF
jgi:flavin-dependent dehydrogenase